MEESRLELKVGALALAALAVAGVLVLALGRLTERGRFEFYADFVYAGGLPAGAVVKIAGVKVGRVRAVEFRPQARDADGRPMPVRLACEIDSASAAALHSDATATVGTQGALGEVYLEVLPGLAREPLAAGAVVRGLDPPRLDVVLSRLYSLLESGVNDQAFRTFLVETAKLAGTIDAMLRDNREALGAFMRDTAAVLSDGRGAMEDVRAAARGASALLSNPELKGAVSDLAQAAKAAREQLPGLLEETRAVASRLDKTAAALGPDDVARVKATLARFDALSTQLQKVAASADTILARVDKGEGTLGALAKDPKVYEDLRALLSDLKAHPWKFLWKE